MTLAPDGSDNETLPVIKSKKYGRESSIVDVGVSAREPAGDVSIAAANTSGPPAAPLLLLYR